MFVVFICNYFVIILKVYIFQSGYDFGVVVGGVSYGMAGGCFYRCRAI